MAKSASNKKSCVMEIFKIKEQTGGLIFTFTFASPHVFGSEKYFMSLNSIFRLIYY
jgi:hypothetical protein